MKIDDELTERCVKLVRDMATSSERMWSVTGKETAAFYDTAIEIAAYLPKPVDPEKEAIRQALGWSWADDDVAWDVTPYRYAVLAFRAGRAFERENG